MYGDVLDATPVDCDGLRVHEYPEGYTVRVPGETQGRLTEAEARTTLSEHPDYVANWRYWRAVGGEGTPRRAFLRWLEGADERRPPTRHAALRDGVAREWGQLSVGVRLIEGERRYSLCHVEDKAESTDALDVLDPLDLRERVKHTDDGRYRPLKTAPTLPTGWVVEDLDGADVVRAIDFVYPATIPNWHREQQGQLDVSHYRETAERQFAHC